METELNMDDIIEEKLPDNSNRISAHHYESAFDALLALKLVDNNTSE